jgi:type IV pilus assembly protein PilB
MDTLKEMKLSGFGCYLVTHGYIDEKKVQTALKESKLKKMSLISCLGQYNFIQYNKLAKATANYFGLPLFDLNSYDFNHIPKDILSTALIQKHCVLPLFKKENQLVLAVADPSRPNLNEINFLTGLTSILVIVELDKLTKAIDSIFSSQLQAGLEIEDAELEATIDFSYPQEKTETDFSQIESDKAPVVKFLNKILFDAIHKQASDIHFEPYENYYRIRFRLDGILSEMSRQPIKLANYLTARLKVMANLDISERRLPQDGRFKLNLSKHRAIDFRLNTCPMLYGEKAVLRILESSRALPDFSVLGMSQNQKKLLAVAIQHSQGMILVTGPTGSGKTMTLYTALNALNKSEVNISSVEDPIEIHLNGINQVQINLKAGLTFANTLRAFLRQDPDIIMVGEIRDLETAEIAVKAAQTGHLVLSTLHTNCAPDTLVRLSNMGVASFNIASSIILIIAQRLVRKLCPQCKVRIDIPENALLEEGFLQEELANLIIYKASSCHHCTQGYKGRVGIYEVMPISKDMARLIMGNTGSLDLAEQAKRENIPNLRRSGLEKVKAGITSLQELNRVIKELN